MEARAATAAAAHRRVKRAMGLLREAARALAPDLDDLDVVGEVAVTDTPSELELVELVRLARHRYGELDVVVLARPRSSSSDRPNPR